MADSVHANPDHLRRLQKAIDRAQQEILDALAGLSRALEEADWRDARRQDFQTKLESASASVRQTTERLEELKSILAREVAALDNYLRRG